MERKRLRSKTGKRCLGTRSSSPPEILQEVTSSTSTSISTSSNDSKASFSSGTGTGASNRNRDDKSGTISKYFKHHLEKDNETVVKNPLNDLESPYRFFTSQAHTLPTGTETDPDNDFKTPNPKIIKRPAKLLSPGNRNKRKGNEKKKKKTNTCLFQKSIKDSFRNLDVNPDHLQMALALSKSSFEAEQGDANVTETSEEFPNVTLRRRNVKATLEQFGFRSNRPKLETETKRNHEIFHPRKKSRFCYVTPVLLLRTDEDRESLITAKISLVLSSTKSKNTPETTPKSSETDLFSDTLKKLHSKNNRLTSLSSLDLTACTDRSVFYSEELPLSPSESKPGTLLKDWHAIPGRDKTPTRETSDNSSNNSASTSARNRSISPDLFDSYLSDEEELESDSGTGTGTGTKSTSLDGKNILEFENEKGICHYESFHYDALIVSQRYCDLRSSDEVESLDRNREGNNETLVETFDLTQSSDEENEKSNENVARPSEDTNEVIECEFVNRGTTDESSRSCKRDSLNNTKSTSTSTSTNTSPIKRVSLENDRFSVGFEINLSTSLNITSYINEILSQDSGCAEKNLTDDKPLPSSQDSVYVISDEELNYSSNFGKENSPLKTAKAKKKLNYYQFSDIQSFEEDSEPLASCTSTIIKNNDKCDDLFNKFNDLASVNPDPDLPETVRHADALNDSLDQVFENFDVNDATVAPKATTSKITTPKNNLIMKTDNVTPMSGYDQMDTPGIVRELSKFGLKPLKRQRGVKLLKYIYETTHPFVGPKESEDSSDDESTLPGAKKRKTLQGASSSVRPAAPSQEFNSCSNDNEELIFERKQSAKIHSCRIPLHIVFSNLINSNRELRESILLYEPLQLEVIHSMIKELGFKFHIQDLLTFLDKKCITVRIAQSQGRRKKNN